MNSKRIIFLHIYGFNILSKSCVYVSFCSYPDFDAATKKFPNFCDKVVPSSGTQKHFFLADRYNTIGRSLPDAAIPYCTV
jgi:hypothetical protein